MWQYEKKLQYPVNIKNSNPKLAKFIISQLGGPDGELAASLRYLNQRYSAPYGEVRGLLTDIGTEVSEMLRFPKMPENPLFTGFWVDRFATKDKLERYGKNNLITYSEQPKAIKQGSERTINIYCAIPEVS